MINIAEQFTRFPGGRYRSDGTYSGERFREEFLMPAVQKGKVEVFLDGTAGYGSSFLEEAFGGLARAVEYSADELLNRIRLISTDPSLIDEITEYIASTRH